MSSDMLQHAIVTLIALVACTVVGRRVLAFAKPRRQEPGCAACPSTQSACATPAQSSAPVVQRVTVFTRPSAPER